MRRLVLILALIAGAGCGGDDKPADAPPTSATTATETSATTVTTPAAPATTVTTKPAPSTTTTTTVSYANCDEVRAAGKAPLRRGQPGYATRLDRDGDGIACDD